MKRLSALTGQIAARAAELEETVLALSAIGDIGAEAAAIRDKVLPKMSQLRLRPGRDPHRQEILALPHLR